MEREGWSGGAGGGEIYIICKTLGNYCAVKSITFTFS